MPASQARAVIEEELGGLPLEEVFEWIDLDEPLGSASIAQVPLYACIHAAAASLWDHSIYTALQTIFQLSYAGLSAIAGLCHDQSTHLLIIDCHLASLHDSRLSDAMKHSALYFARSLPPSL